MTHRPEISRLMKSISCLLLIIFTVMPGGNSWRPAYAINTGAAFALEASVGTKDCGDCEKKDSGQTEGALCALRYVIYFLWFSFLAVAGVLIVVMDLVTGFSQGYTGDFVEWAMGKTDSLHRFFRALGCG